MGGGEWGEKVRVVVDGGSGVDKYVWGRRWREQRVGRVDGMVCDCSTRTSDRCVCIAVLFTTIRN